MPTRRVWVPAVGSLVLVNGVAWRRDTGTFCSTTLRPLVVALPAGEWLLAAGLGLLWHHVVSPILKERT